MTGNGHEMPSASHCVAQQGQMAVVDVRTVERDDMVQLSLQSLTHCFNTKDLCEKTD